MSTYSLGHLSNDALTLGLAAATTADRRSTAAHLAHLAEFDHRRLYAPEGCSSMFRYCVERLRMSEDVAVQRIRAARVAHEHPHVYEAVASGRLSLSALYLLSKHLTRENAVSLLAAAEGRSNRQVARMIAERFGRAFTKRLSGADPRDAAPFTRSDTGSGDETYGLVESLGALVTRTATGRSPDAAGGGSFGLESLACGVEGDELAHAQAADSAAGRASRRAALRPVAPGQYELVAILGQEAYDQLVASVDLLGHAVPSGDLAEVLERAIALQLAHLRKRRCGAADRPRNGAPRVSSNPRHVPNAVVRAVWQRDGDQCTFVGSGGHRCEARDRLELDHIVSVARGGKSTLENLRLLCHTHNQHVAELTFGAATMQGRREAAKRRRAEERLRKQADRERTEARKREIARQHEELGEAFRTLGYRGDDLRRALAYCAERAVAPPEERLRHALGCLAPNARREGPAHLASSGG